MLGAARVPWSLPPHEVAVFQIPAVLIALLLLAALPVWPWSRGWGWAPAGMLAMGLGTLIVFSLAVVPESGGM